MSAEPFDTELPPLEAYADEPAAQGFTRAKLVDPPPRPNGGHQGQQRQGAEPFPASRLSELQSALRPAVVQGLGFDHGTVVAIVGQPNAGKTAFAVSLAMHVAGRAERWLDRRISPGPVLYFAAEAPGSVIMRARAAAARFDREPALYICAHTPSVGGELTSAADALRIIATIREVESAEGEAIRLVFIDTLASCLGDGDENGDGMLRLVSAAKAIAASTDVCVVLLHHPSKGDASGLRGHGSLSAACDSIVRIEVDELTGTRTATLVKARDHATGAQIQFQLEPIVLTEPDSFGDPLTTIVVKPVIGIQNARPRPKGVSQQKLLTDLERRHRTGETRWDEATVCKAGRDLGMHRNSASTALRGLQQAGYVVGPANSIALKYPPE